MYFTLYLMRMLAEVLSNPITIFLISVLVASLIYSLGQSKKKANADKSAPYACGQCVAAEREPVSIHIFEFAAVFLVFDVIAIMLIFSFDTAFTLLPIIYVALAAVALYSLPVFRRRR